MNQKPKATRRVLIITYHFPPSSAVAVFRMLGFARHLPRFGWRVGVVTPGRVPGEPLDESLLECVPKETEVFTVPYPDSVAERTARRWLYHAVWLPRAVPALIRAVHKFRPDAVLTSGPPHCVHFLGWFLKRFYHLPWAACFRDPWFTNWRPSKKTLFSWGTWEEYWEKRLFPTADCIIANTPRTCDGLCEAFPELSHKIKFVTNGFDPECFPPLGQKAAANERFTILHAGELYMGRDPRPFFDALARLEKTRAASEPPMRVVLLGQATENRFDLNTAVAERGLEKVVEVGGQVSYRQALATMPKADLLLLVDTPGRTVSIPAKLFEYFGAGRPVLALTEPDGDVVWALQTSGVPHRIVPPQDSAQIQQALIELRDGIRQGILTAPPPEQLANFTRAKLAHDLAGHLNTLVPIKQMVGVNGDLASMPALANHASQRIPAAPPARRPHYARA
ncbi:MAG TPA: glycosyltransferase family 4 protein [Gemmataceae bacterium]|nr:glycosyltransferase family 4 protein [Gemmataceae bacterium]